MGIAKKIADKNHNDASGVSTRHVSKHGLGRSLVKFKKALNRIAKRKAEKIAFKDAA